MQVCKCVSAHNPAILGSSLILRAHDPAVSLAFKVKHRLDLALILLQVVIDKHHDASDIVPERLILQLKQRRS